MNNLLDAHDIAIPVPNLEGVMGVISCYIMHRETHDDILYMHAVVSISDGG